MSVGYYDDALLNKIKNWVQDPNIKITGPNETSRMFKARLDQQNDDPIKLPMIAISRMPSITIQSTNKKPMSYDGWRKNGNSEKGDQLNAIPIGISYNIDIYTRYLEEADNYVREFVFNIINYPKLTIEIPYNNAKITHVANIRIGAEIEDNSDVPERLEPGQFTRFTIPIEIDDAHLFDYRIKDTSKVVIESVDIELQSDLNVKKEIKE